MFAAAVLSGCKQSRTETDNTGTLVLKSIEADTQLNDVTVGTKAMPSDLVNLSEFEVTVTNKLESGFSQTYNYGDIMDKAIELPTGSYTLTASTPATKNLSAAWDQPIFSGSADFAVAPQATSPVTVKCSMQNAVVSVRCSDTFLTELSSFEIKVYSSDNRWLTWTKDNINANGYFTGTDLSVQIDGVRSIDGSTAGITGNIRNIRPKDHIILNVDARVTGQVQSIVITVDGSVKDRNESILIDGFTEIEIPDPEPPTGGDEPNDPITPPTTPDGPSLEWPKNPTFAPMALAAEMDVELTVKAPGKIKDFVVDVNSPTLNAILPSLTMGGNCTLDLINDTNLINNLAAIGVVLPAGDMLKGKTEAAFSLSSLVPMIHGLSPDSGSNHLFTLKVTDENNKTYEKTLTFYAE